jgi:hypothetical protein
MCEIGNIEPVEQPEWGTPHPGDEICQQGEVDGAEPPEPLGLRRPARSK